MPRNFANLADFGDAIISEVGEKYVGWATLPPIEPGWVITDSRKRRRRPDEIVTEEQAIELEIRDSSFILSIEKEDGDEAFVSYTEETLNRATHFLRRLMIHAHSCGFSGIGVPEILPAQSGDIGLFWHLEDKSLLMTFPADSSRQVSYFGRNGDREISGRFKVGDFTPELVYWLTN
jgi:hypothetical protein